MKKLTFDASLGNLSLRDTIANWCFCGVKRVTIDFDDDVCSASFHFVHESSLSTKLETISALDVSFCESQPVLTPEPVSLLPTQEQVVPATEAVVPDVSPTETVSAKRLTYEDFVRLSENDDGSEQVKVETANYLDNAPLDDLLRINNEFSLGLDTDKPVKELRSEVKSCFQ